MLQLFKLAYRDLGRNRRRSFFSALALGMGLALLLLMAAVIQGEIAGSLATATRLQSGHLQVRSKSYDENRTSLKWQDLIEKPDQVAAQISGLAPVQVATPRLFASGIAAAGDTSAGVRVIGIDPASEASAPFREGLVGGSFLGASDSDGVLIGLPLADKLGIRAGDKIILSVNTSNGDVDQQTFTIRGVYSTRTPSYDQSTVFLALPKAQAIARAENHASTIFVVLKDRAQTDAVANALTSDEFSVKTWKDMNSLVLETEELANGYMIVLYLIVLAITATVIVNTLVMAVFERTREIGILSAIGMRGRSIMALFLAESSLLAIGGIVIGLVLGALLVLYASVVGFAIPNVGVTAFLIGERIYAQANLSDTLRLTILAFVVSLIASLYPAALAARMEPVEALRGGQ